MKKQMRQLSFLGGIMSILSLEMINLECISFRVNL